MFFCFFNLWVFIALYSTQQAILGLGFFLPWLESSQIGFVLFFSGNIICGARISAACSNSVLAIVIFGVSEL